MACRQVIYPPIYQKGIGESAARAIDRIVEGLDGVSPEAFLLVDQAPWPKSLKESINGGRQQLAS
jgi:hypothetical protein